jgi:hypothetical protein
MFIKEPKPTSTEDKRVWEINLGRVFCMVLFLLGANGWAGNPHNTWQSWVLTLAYIISLCIFLWEVFAPIIYIIGKSKK